MEPKKVTPWDDYNYTAKITDFYTGCGVLIGAAFFYGYNSKFMDYGGSSLTTRALQVAKVAPGFLLAGYLAGRAFTALKDSRIRQRLTYMEEYMAAHPEDFETIPNKKFKDVLLEWTPIR